MGWHQRRRDFWERQIAEWAQSGQPASTWCAERGLSPGRFYLWRRRLRSNGGGSPKPLTFHPLPQARPTEPSEQPPGLEIRVGTARVLVPRDADP
ncbi:IS66 family insertion sequence element accessory protein TnpA, partial [Acidithiobacillus sp.]|uniref:IS66 family insertion sequence element accessory protein TnpA n=1 Tax=Acidithiobacillus sp. TaxID=1872118 RepID=UPI003CFD83CE